VSIIDYDQEALVERYCTPDGMERVIISHLLRYPEAVIYSVLTECGLDQDTKFSHASALVNSYVSACFSMVDQKLIRRVIVAKDNNSTTHYAQPKMMARYHMVRNHRRMMDAFL
jgi:hypothetical protein